MADNTPSTFVFPVEPAASSNREVEGQNIRSWQNRLPGVHIPPSFGPLAPPARKSSAKTTAPVKRGRGGAPPQRAVSFPDLPQESSPGMDLGAGPSHNPPLSLTDSPFLSATAQAHAGAQAPAGPQEQFSVEQYVRVTNDVIEKLADKAHNVCDRFADSVAASTALHGEVPKILDNTNTIVDNHFKYWESFEGMVGTVSGMASDLHDTGTDLHDAALDIRDVAEDMRDTLHALVPVEPAQAAVIQSLPHDDGTVAVMPTDASANDIAMPAPMAAGPSSGGQPGDSVPFSLGGAAFPVAGGSKRAREEPRTLLARMGLTDGPVRKKRRRGNKPSAVVRGKRPERVHASRSRSPEGRE